MIKEKLAQKSRQCDVTPSFVVTVYANITSCQLLGYVRQLDSSQFYGEQ